MSLLEKIKKNSTIKDTAILAQSKFFAKKDMVQLSVPALNIAFSGSITGGFVPGLTQWCGPSKHFKTTFSLIMAKAYMDKYPDSVILFYDSEFGSPQSYFTSMGIDIERVIHTPITDFEQLKHDCVQQLNGIERGEHLMIIIDSIGNLASKKEVDDAMDGKVVADMSRAKSAKSFFRMVTPHLTLKDIPMVVINHTYKEIGTMYPKEVVAGGTGNYYSSDNIFMLGRQQEKDGTEVIGYNFIINVEKSRYVKEKSKIPISVTFEGGISTWSGLLDIALELGFVTKPSNGWYTRPKFDEDGKKYREKDTDTAQFWMPLLKDAEFKLAIEQKYQLAANQMYQTSVDNTVEE